MSDLSKILLIFGFVGFVTSQKVAQKLFKRMDFVADSWELFVYKVVSGEVSSPGDDPLALV